MNNTTQVMEFKNYTMSPKSYDIDQMAYTAKLAEAGLDNVAFKSLLTEGDTVSVIPFPQIKGSEYRVWKTYCPTRSKIEEYKDFIPVEALDILIKHGKNFQIPKPEMDKEAAEGTKVRWGTIEIWSEAKEVIDPILVGVLHESNKYSWGWGSPDQTFYLLAQWGEALKPFEEIFQIVKKRLMEEARLTIAGKLKEINSVTGQEELLAFEYLNCKSNSLLPYGI